MLRHPHAFHPAKFTVLLDFPHLARCFSKHNQHDNNSSAKATNDVIIGIMISLKPQQVWRKASAITTPKLCVERLM